jgi:hypothetical protein
LRPFRPDNSSLYALIGRAAIHTAWLSRTINQHPAMLLRKLLAQLRKMFL